MAFKKISIKKEIKKEMKKDPEFKKLWKKYHPNKKGKKKK